ncbi:MAG: PH domain-containing protein [Clostridia bacterium]|nr:PH domain-containing protein [Clostridia bacterium]MDD4386511.1 PH domain-containing protein [Clostridia bacterium]
MEEKNLLYKVEPSFNIIYEMFMPTGKKIRNTLVILILIIVCYFFLNRALSSSEFSTYMIQETNFDIYSIFNNISIFIIVIFIIKLIIHFVIQILQYNSIKYSFYNDYLEYEDTFLNQHKKTLRYDNIKEIEIRRTIWDRMNGYGIIIIYTNAEKSYSNGLILFSIKEPLKTYTKIDEIIHAKYSVQNVNLAEKENSFKESLDDKNRGE